MPNYRNVYKSDHLGVIDLEELVDANKPLIFTIKQVKQEKGVIVAGNRGDFNIAYFNEPIKPLVLNATNAAMIRRLGRFGIDVDTWKDLTIELYIDANVKMKGQIVGGVRIKPMLPKTSATVTIDDKPAIAKINAAKSLDELKTAWSSITPQEQALPSVTAAKDSRKKELIQ
jgi:hypothetical protein